jgi:hypothetical protein
MSLWSTSRSRMRLTLAGNPARMFLTRGDAIRKSMIEKYWPHMYAGKTYAR